MLCIKEAALAGKQPQSVGETNKNTGRYQELPGDHRLDFQSFIVLMIISEKSSATYCSRINAE